MNLLYLDIYARRASLFYNNHEKIGSYFGLFLTLIYVIAPIVLLVYYLTVTINRYEMRVYDSSLYAQEMPLINLDKNMFYFAFGLEDPVTLNRYVDDSIYRAEIVFIDRIKENGEFKTVKRETLPLEKCHVENFGDNYQHLFVEGELANSFCLKDFDYNLTFVGGFKYERMSYLRIKIFPCTNKTENNITCKSQEIIDHYLTSSYFSILLKDIGLNPANFSYPVLPTLQDLYTTIDRRLYKNYILNFGLTEIQTDVGLLYENFRYDKYIQFKKEIQTFSFRDESEYLSGNDICIVQIRLDDTILVQKRTYTKVSEILSRIGGYMQLINTVFLLLSLMTNKYDFEVKILNSIFNFSIKKNKIALKYQNLQSLSPMVHSQTNKHYSFSKNKSIKNITDSENKSNIHLILKSNHTNFITSSLNLSEIPNNSMGILRKRYNNSLAHSNKNVIIPFREGKRKFYESKFHSNKNVSFNDRNLMNNRASFGIFEKEMNNSIKECTDNINLNMLDFICPHRNRRKKKLLELYKIGINFYKKRMDIALVFTHLLLIEKILLKKHTICLLSDR